MSMSIDAKELNSRLWAEWKNGMKIMAESLMKDSVDLTASLCTCVLGNENFVQRAVIYIQRKSYIGKFKDYKTRISAYEKTVMELIEQVNRMLAGAAPHKGEAAAKPSAHLVGSRVPRDRGRAGRASLPGFAIASGESVASGAAKIEYKSTLAEIIIDGDDRLENSDWGDHAIAAFENLGDYLNNIMNILEATQKEIGK